MRAGTTEGMKSIIWKELRENYRWTLLGFIGMFVAMGAALEPIFGGFRIISWKTESIVADEFQAVTVVGCAIVGFALGLLQVVFEARGERLSLLVHRPMARSAIFGAKVVAGGVLYLAATGVPYLLASWWAATPGHIPAPFALSMMIPGALDIVLGFSYYFAGFLAGTRKARWYGSRGFGVPVAALCTLLSFAAPPGVSLLVAATGIAVLAVAAWGTFLAGGSLDAQPRVARAALSAGLLTGLAVVGYLGTVAVHLTAMELGLRYSNPEVRARPNLGGYFFFGDGRARRGPTDDQMRPEFVPLQNRVRVPEERFFRFHGRFVGLHGFYDRTWIFDPVEGVIYEYDTPEWRTADGPVEFAGYLEPSSLTPQPEKPEKRLEYLGDGFGWRGDGGRLYYTGQPELLFFSEFVYECDRRSRHVLYTPPEGERIIGGRTIGSRDGRSSNAYAIVATQEAVIVLNSVGEAILRTPMVPERERFDRVSVTPIEGDRYALYFVPRTIVDGVLAREEVVRIVSASGEVLEENRLTPPLLRWRRGPPYYDYAGPVLPIPALALAAFERRVDDFPRHSTVLARWYLFLCLALLSAAGAFVITRRFAFGNGRVLLWTAMSFVLGPVGLFTLISLESWPAREICEGCGRPRLVTRSTCEHCGAEWPAPRPDGTEIFEAR